MKKYSKRLVALTSLFLGIGMMSARASDTTTSPVAATKGSTRAAVYAQHRQIEKGIRRSFNKTKDLDASDVRVLVKGDAVILAGSVQDQEQVKKAELAAGGTAGVQSVTNQLVVREKGGH